MHRSTCRLACCSSRVCCKSCSAFPFDMTGMHAERRAEACVKPRITPHRKSSPVAGLCPSTCSQPGCERGGGVGRQQGTWTGMRGAGGDAGEGPLRLWCGTRFVVPRHVQVLDVAILGRGVAPDTASHPLGLLLSPPGCPPPQGAPAGAGGAAGRGQAQ